MSDASEANEARVVAQAKINLFLRVLAREASGFHQIETLFQRLELGDDVRVHVGARGRTLDWRGVAVGPVEQNLAWRAATAYAEAVGWPNGFALEVEKRIPVGGGLGGGSADAGAVLRCLNALAPRPLSTTELLAIAAPLGSDVPFLTADTPLALAWGRGDRMMALPSLPARRAHLAVFSDGVSTAAAYDAIAARQGASRPAPVIWQAARFASWDDVALVATNDFEDVVLPARTDIAEMRRLFSSVGRRVEPGAEPAGVTPGWGARNAAPFALMSGSGATVFLLSPEHVGLTFEVNAAPDSHADALRVLETRTATRVAEVQVAG